MSPISRKVLLTSDTGLPAPFIELGTQRASVRVANALFTVDTVDAQGYLKAGVPVTRAGILPGVAPAFVFGSVPEPIRVSTGNTAPLLAAIPAQNIGLATDAVVNRAALEDVLGRALSADELAAYDRAGSNSKLVY